MHPSGLGWWRPTAVTVLRREQTEEFIRALRFGMKRFIRSVLGD